jgi:hypothetical protein
MKNEQRGYTANDIAKIKEEGGTMNEEQQLISDHLEALKKDEVKINFGSVYIRQIENEGKTPTSYIWNGRRILRSTLQCLVKKLEETGKVKAVMNKEMNSRSTFNDDLSNRAPHLYRLTTDDENYKEFVEGLNQIMEQYDKLFDGSKKIRQSVGEEVV